MKEIAQNQIQSELEKVIVANQELTSYYMNRYNLKKDNDIAIFEYPINKLSSEAYTTDEVSTHEIQFRLNIDIKKYFAEAFKILNIDNEIINEAIKSLSINHFDNSYMAKYNQNEFYGKSTTYGIYGININEIMKSIEFEMMKNKSTTKTQLK